jgi:two-component sensor histidine kinase
MSALFSLQARNLRDPEARAQFSEAVGRINSMALAYRRMHSTEELEAVEFASYLRELCAAISNSLMQDHACQVEADTILLEPQQASSLVLIANELVTNAIKHGTKNSPVNVTFERTEDRCCLTVRSFGLLPADNDAGSGFGMQMVTILVNQLDGRLDVSARNGQIEFAVTFSPTVPQQQLTALDQESNAPRASG